MTRTLLGNLASHAYTEIKRQIFDFVLMPNDKIFEAELAQRIQVSRTPLRQALQRLEHEGFVQALPKIGWLVSPLDFDKLDELYDFRILLECYAVAQMCKQTSERTVLTQLEKIWCVNKRKRLTDGMKVGELDEQFHRQLVQTLGNELITKTHTEITEKIRIVRRLDFTKTPRIEATYEEHAKILEAIAERRAPEAQRLLTAHIQQSKIEVRKITLDMLQQARAQAA